MDTIEEKYNAIMDEIASNNSKIISNITENHLTFQEKLSELMSYVDNTLSDTKRLVSEQDEKIKDLSTKLDTNKFEESNFNKVSVLKNQDKQIRELNIKVEELESKNRFLQNKIDEMDKLNNKSDKTKSTKRKGRAKKPKSEPSTPEPEPETKSEPEPEPEPEQETKSEPEPETKSEPEPETKSEPEPETKSEPEPEPEKKKKKEKKVKKKKKVIEIDVNAPIPSIDDIDVIEVKDVTYYINRDNNYVYQVLDNENEDIGIILGLYDDAKNKIHFIE